MAMIYVQVASRPDRAVITKFGWFRHLGGMQKKCVL